MCYVISCLWTYTIIIRGNFRGAQTFRVFEGRTVNAKIKTGMNSHVLVFQILVGVVS